MQTKSMNAMNEQAWYCVPKGLHAHEPSLLAHELVSNKRSDHAVAAQLTKNN